MIKVAESIISVGIDIGTTTTQLIFSRFTIENTAGATSVPRISIIDKQVVYESAIHITPLISRNKIDEDAVRQIVIQEYAAAGIEPKSVTTGAVIITGETARKENASTVLGAMSGLAGDFVVATAGPDLEGIIAGKGSGAAKTSLEQHKTTVNLDVGGGTTNIAVFSEGEVSATACFDIGGRLIKFKSGGMIVDYIAPKLEKYCLEAGIHIREGHAASKQDLIKICSWMASILLASVGLSPNAMPPNKPSPNAMPPNKPSSNGSSPNTMSPYGSLSNSQLPNSQLSNGPAPAGLAKITDLEYMATDQLLSCSPPELLMFSGGVADYIYNAPEQDIPHGDIGALLGRQIRSAFSGAWGRVRVPLHTIRATVIGAGMYSTELSGSTITYTGVEFPLKNIPIIRLTRQEEALPEERFAGIVRERLAWYRDGRSQSLAALSMTGVHNITYSELVQYARSISEGMSPIGEAGLPYIIIVEHDMAKALGQALLPMIKSRSLVCIDSVSTSQGDYIDIGAPLMGGRVLPIVIKTLVFN